VLDLLGEGQISPGAAAVAERSGVSLRSVFRYFDDMDSLMDLAIARQMERAGQWFDLIDVTGPVETRAEALAERRLTQHTHLAPYARAALIRAHEFPAVAQGLATRRDALRRQVESLFAPELDSMERRTREEVLAALEGVTSLEVVEVMVSHRGLSPSRVEATLVRSILGILRT
jgi:AcrR family transcriptional regulator